MLLTLLESVDLMFQGCLKLAAKPDLSPKRKGKCGRKCKTTPRTDKLLITKSVICPDKTSKDLQRGLAAGGVVIDSSTVQCRLLEVGRTARRPIKKTTPHN